MKKRLLKEETTRRFMKLANLQPIKEGYFEEEEDPEVGMDALGTGEPEMGEPEMGDEEATLDAEPEGEGCTDDVVSLVDAIAAAIEQATGCQMSVANDGPAEEPPVDDALPVEDEGPVMEADTALEEDDGVEEALNEANIQLADDREEWLVKETLRRVTKRLVKASKKE